jgi:heterodisulfide reductase subunit C
VRPSTLPAISLDQAREQYETHQEYCRQCAADTLPCPAAKHLRRAYNNAIRASGSGQSRPAR